MTLPTDSIPTYNPNGVDGGYNKYLTRFSTEKSYIYDANREHDLFWNETWNAYSHADFGVWADESFPPWIVAEAATETLNLIEALNTPRSDRATFWGFSVTEGEQIAELIDIQGVNINVYTYLGDEPLSIVPLEAIRNGASRYYASQDKNAGNFRGCSYCSFNSRPDDCRQVDCGGTGQRWVYESLARLGKVL